MLIAVFVVVRDESMLLEEMERVLELVRRVVRSAELAPAAVMLELMAVNAVSKLLEDNDRFTDEVRNVAMEEFIWLRAVSILVEEVTRLELLERCEVMPVLPLLRELL